MAKILITGGSGQIGTRLTEILLERGHEVVHLGRSAGIKNGVQTYQWDYTKNYIDTDSLVGVDYIFNLVGAGISSKRWNEQYKNEIYKSRVQSTALLIHTLKLRLHKIKKLVQASGISIYEDNTEGFLDENAAHGHLFLSDVCIDWEQAANEALFIKIEPITVRIGIVLGKNSGFIQATTKPINAYLGAPLGSGKQMVSWIHIDDLCNMLIHLLFLEKAEGAYNAVSKEPVSNKVLLTEIARRLGKPMFLPGIPEKLLRIIFGGITEELLSSHKLSSDKISATGFTFKYPTLDKAMDEIFTNTKA